MDPPVATAAAVREMTHDDAPAVARIYSEAIERLESTRELEPQSAEQCAAWILSGDGRFSGWVAERGGEVAGFASLTRLYPRAAYNATAELSVYVALAHRGQGIGRALADHVIACAEPLDYHLLVAFMFREPAWLVELALRRGFVDRGALPEAGDWGGELRDVMMLSLRFDGGPPEGVF